MGLRAAPVHGRLRAALVSLVLLAAACGPGGSTGDVADSVPAEVLDVAAPSDLADLAGETGTEGADADLPELPSMPETGSLWVLTYNVAGLPQGFSGSDPEKNIPLISPLLNDFDLVLVQEDFHYHDALAAEVEHPYVSIPWDQTHVRDTMGDGLNRFSQSPFIGHERIPWPGCSGLLDCSSDCLATKGFAGARHSLAPGIEVDVYNLHMEAGGCPEDEALRAAGMTLLLETIAERSQGYPVIVAGDFNLHDDDAIDVEQLQRLTDAGFVAACWYLECGESHIDRIFVRDGGGVALIPLEWQVPAQFVDEAGKDLSDHEPVAARLEYRPE
jgi:endonuclease/exonuclease/phosphatase family metal-dependent hydrolase